MVVAFRNDFVNIWRGASAEALAAPMSSTEGSVGSSRALSLDPPMELWAGGAGVIDARWRVGAGVSAERRIPVVHW
jgi:hypothetical protein